METMSGGKLEVIWSPVHHDKFIIWGSDITLYQVSRLKDIEKKTAFTQISGNRGATVIASQSANGVRCVDVSAAPEQAEPLLALGHASGRVSLTALKQTLDPLGLVGREFNPRYSRLCNSVSWSHVETNLLAVAMEKHRSDHCILLWDVNRGSTPPEESKSAEAALVPTPDSAKPLAEMGLSETAHNVSWSNCSNRTLLASVNLKYIKIFDLRDLSNKGVLVATSRYCYGACSDPFNPWQLASRGESVVCVWDARALQRPLLTLPQPRHVTRIQWCPTRRNLLLSLQRDASALRLHDVQQGGRAPAEPEGAVEAEPEEPERGPSVLERDVTPAPPAPAAAAPAPLAAFCWHPAHEARLLAVNVAGGVCDYTVCERVTVAWGGGGLVWAGGGGRLRFLPDAQQRDLHDISYTMRRRAQTDYGLKGFVAKWSSERTRALSLCGWGWGWENAAAGVERAEAAGTPCRAAALAAFHLRLRHALDVLARAREPQLRVVALALAGLSDERLWRDALAAAAPALPDAYLRALLLFLAASAPAAPAPPSAPPAPSAELDAVLAETEMRLEDRVAFACVYLSDAKLHDYIRRTTDELVEAGDLSGILLTGASLEGVALLQRWVERTGDVQSAALVAARCLPPELLRADAAADPRERYAAGWLGAYRLLLDGWRLWWARSALDTCAGEAGGRRVAVACSYCGKSVAAPHARPAARPAFARLPPPAAKMKQISSCPNCRKPLPRCGVCSLHLGGAAPGAGGGGGQFGGWFSWCVACRHGGHAAHLLEWFKEHTECPVSSCTCHCSTLDPPDCP
ncbi:GATOR2 complex protein MIOS [Ostrinia nubilalis]|uniref:GATOR2 complex protein MIOS n=1 Tax=Ostrinia nubilalis TaxID=29057 RepID=UPI003082333A